MFRIALTAYLMLTSLTGFSPCCCTASRIVASIGIGKSPAGHTATCCGHFGGCEEEDQDPKPDSLESSPLQAPHRCQCVKNTCGGVPSQKIEMIVGQAESWLLNGCLVPADLYRGLVCVENVSLADLRESPPVASSGRELRVSLCSWRC